MSSHDLHVCRLFGSPWPGVFGTDIDSARVYGRHWHDTYGLGVMERGAHRSLSGRGLVDAIAGQIITTNPGEVHDGRPMGVASRQWRMVYLDAGAMREFTGTGGRHAADVHLTRPVADDIHLAAALRHLLGRLDRWSHAKSYSSDEALACEESLVRVCDLALRGHSTARPLPDAPAEVARVRDCLADDLVHTPSLAALAALVGLSRYQLLRRFERVYGLTPFRWQRQVRTERARSLVAAGCPLATAAARCGFADQSHMSRAFLEHFGFTPGAWASRTARRTA